MKPLQRTPQSSRRRRRDVSSANRLRDGLEEVAGRYRKQLLAAALLPFSVLGTAATLLGWLLSRFPALAAGSWPAMLAGWLVGFCFFVLPGLRRIEPERAAGLLDRLADQKDRFRSAWHFLEARRDSPMECLTVERAEQQISVLDLRPLFPLRISKAVAPLCIFSVSLLGYGFWAGGTDLEPEDRQSPLHTAARQVARELRRVIPDGDPEVEELLQDLEIAGSLDQMLALIEEMRERLGPAGLDEALLAADLEKLSADLDENNPLAAALASGNFEELADALGQLPPGSRAAQDLQEFLDDLPAPESMAQSQTRDLLQDLQGARKALREGDAAEAARKLDSAARELREMGQEKRSQQQNRAAAKAMEGLQQRMQEEGQTPVDGPSENAGGGSMASGGTASPSEAPAEESANGQMAGSEGTASSPGPQGETEEGARTPLDARFEVEFGQARSLVREPSGRKTRELPSIQVQAVRPPSDGRIRVRQELEQALNHLEVPLELRERIRDYLLAINDGKRDSSGN